MHRQNHGDMLTTQCIEKNLEQIWVLVEKVLRTLELRESVRSER